MFKFNKIRQVDILNDSLDEIIDCYYSIFILQWEKTYVTIKRNRKKIKHLIYQELDSFHFSHGLWQVKKNAECLGVKKLSSELGHLTGLWNIDWLWIIHHISFDYRNQMIAFNNIKLSEIGRIKYYKYIPMNYYEIAESIYLKSIETREPKLFDFNELYKNGSGLKKKSTDFKPVIGATLWDGFNNEFWDMTELRVLTSDYSWSNDKKDFELKPFNRKIERKSKVKIRIGNSEREI
jgi:hypothetical protein